MDPISVSTTLATLVGLLCNFRQEKGAAERLDHQNFIEWLEYHRHEEIKDLICNTHHLQTDVDRLLREDTQHLIQKLNGIEGEEPVLFRMRESIRTEDRQQRKRTSEIHPHKPALLRR